MKKLVFLVFLMFFSLGSLIVAAADSENVNGSEVVTIEEKAFYEEESRLLEMRIKEIREMDKSELTAEEREELRKELRYIREQARRPFIVISASTVIVVLLLILLLR